MGDIMLQALDFTELEAGCLAIYEVLSETKMKHTLRFTEDQEVEILKYPDNRLEPISIFVDKKSIETVKYHKGDYLLILLNIPPFDTTNTKMCILPEASDSVNKRSKFNGFGKCLLDYAMIQNKLDFIGSLYTSTHSVAPTKEIMYVSVYAHMDGYLPLYKNIFGFDENK